MHDQGAHSIRNVAIVAHVDHGKTTLSDALLLKAGLLHKDRAGDQDKGRSLDTLQDEKDRGITIKSAAITLDLTANARVMAHGPSGEALARAVNNNEKKTAEANKEEQDNVVDVYMGKLPLSITTPAQLEQALQRQGVKVDSNNNNNGDNDRTTISVNARRNYATLSVRPSLADQLVAMESIDIDGKAVSIEMAGSNGMSRLRAYCEKHKMDMPVVAVREVASSEHDVAFSGVATWDALGGVLIQAADVYSTPSKARQAVAEECLRFVGKQENGFQAPETKAESRESSNESDTELCPEEAEEFDIQNDKVPIRLNLIDSPGHIDFNAEVTSALRICDGALVVVDAIEGKAVQTDNVLMQALKEGVRPVLMINKVDRLIVDKQLEPEEIYDAMMRVVNQVNTFIQSHQLDNFPDQRVRFEDGSVCFGSGYFGWSCSVDTFILKDCPLEKYLPYRKALAKKDNFVKNIIQPIVRLHRLCGALPTKKQVPASERVRLISVLLNNVGKPTAAKIKQEETEQPRKLLKKVMMAWLPAADALTDMLASALPSPVEAQAMRASLLYTGEMKDDCGQGIMGCDSTGPTVVYVSKMAPSTEGKKTLVAYGRVFSGKLKAGDSLYALHGRASPVLATVAKIMYCGLGGKMHAIRSAEAGDLVALEGVDKALQKAGTLCSEQSASPIKHMHFSVTPVVQHGIRPKDSKQLTKMVLEMNRIVNADSTARFYKDTDTEEYILAGAGALHIEILVSQLFQNSKIEVHLSEPRVNYRETVQSESSVIALAKSDNKHNRIWMKASRLPDEIVAQMASGNLQGLDVKSLGKKLSSDYGWDSSEASRIWAVGPEPTVGGGSSDDQPTCLLVDSTFGMQIPDDAKANITNSFMQVVSQGVLVGSPLHGVRFDLMDAKFHQDSVHRRPNSIVPAASRAMKGAFLYAEPAILEPVFKAVVTGAPGTVNSAFSVLGNRGGQIVDTSVSDAGDVIEARLPVRRSFGLSGQLCGESQGHAQCSLSFEGVQLVPESEQDTIIAETRVQKKLSSDVPSVSHFVDKL